MVNLFLPMKTPVMRNHAKLKKGVIFMKVAITSHGNNLDSEVSPVFARCPYFIMANVEDGEIKTVSPVENPAMNQRGSGNLAAQFLVNQRVDTLISGAVGPNAFNIFKQVGIKIYKLQSGSVQENLNLFVENKLDEIKTSGPAGSMAGRGFGRR